MPSWSPTSFVVKTRRDISAQQREQSVSEPISKRPQGLSKRVLSHFVYGESLAVGTRICCVVGGRPDSTHSRDFKDKSKRRPGGPLRTSLS